jgi:hypothetical protein
LKTAERLAVLLLEFRRREDEATVLLGEVLEARRRLLGHDHRATLETQFQLARALSGSDHARSLEVLTDLVAAGWTDRRLMEDPRFAPLRDDSQFAVLVDDLQRRLDHTSPDSRSGGL